MKSLFIRNAPDTVTKEDLLVAFAQFGEVLPTTRVVRRKMAPPNAKPLCFVDFATEEAAQAALRHSQPVLVAGVAVDFEEERVQPPLELYFAPVDNEDMVRGILAADKRLPHPTHVRMTTKPSSANGDLFAFVQFESEDDNMMVVEALNGRTLANGKMLTVQKSRRTSRGGPGGPRRFGGRGAGGGAPHRSNGGGGGAGVAIASYNAADHPSTSRGARHSAPAGQMSEASQYTVHVGNLPPGTSPEMLKSMFQAYGEVSRVVQKGHSTTTVFVEFDSPQGMDKAVMNAQQESGGKLQVTPSKGRPNSVHVVGFDNHPNVQSVTDAFSKFGKVVSVNILEPRAYAFVSYTTPDGAKKAMAVNEVLTINNVRLTIVESTSNARGNARNGGGGGARSSRRGGGE